LQCAEAAPAIAEATAVREARLTAEARRLGFSVDTLLARLLGAHAEPTPRRPRPELPERNLGAGHFAGATL
jgi:hypothetical protein